MAEIETQSFEQVDVPANQHELAVRGVGSGQRGLVHPREGALRAHTQTRTNTSAQVRTRVQSKRLKLRERQREREQGQQNLQ